MHAIKIQRSPQLVYKNGYKYQLQQPYFIQTPFRPERFVTNGWVSLDVDGMMLLMHGYAWDGPSGAPDINCTMIGSLMHDGGYQLMREGLLPQTSKLDVDRLMAELMHSDGMWLLCARFFQLMVNKFGRRFTIKPTKTITLMAR